MANRTWNINGHVISLTHGWWSGRAALIVDDETEFVRESPPLWLDFGFAHRFQVEGVEYAVRVTCTFWMTFHLELLTGEQAARIVEADSLAFSSAGGMFNWIVLFGGVGLLVLATVALSIFGLLKLLAGYR